MCSRQNDGWQIKSHKSVRQVIRVYDIFSRLIAFASTLRNECQSSAVDNSMKQSSEDSLSLTVLMLLGAVLR